MRDKYRNLWLEKQFENQNISITELIESNKGAYKWLNKNDKEWLLNNSPSAKETVQNNIIDWHGRDIDYCNIFKNIVNKELSKEDKPIRITKTYLFRKAKLFNQITVDLDKLPITKQFLEDTCEVIEKYHLRRLKRASDYAFNNGLSQTYSNIFRIASIGDNYYDKYKDIFKNQ